MPLITIDGHSLTIEDVGAVANGARVAIGDGVLERVSASRAVVEQIVTGDAAVYGINTGFGKLSDMRIRAEVLRAL